MNNYYRKIAGIIFEYHWFNELEPGGALWRNGVVSWGRWAYVEEEFVLSQSDVKQVKEP